MDTDGEGDRSSQDEAAQTERLRQLELQRDACERRLASQKEIYETRVHAMECEVQAARQRVLELAREISANTNKIAALTEELGRQAVENAHIAAELAVQAQFRARIEASRSFRLLRLYARLHDDRFLGKPIRMAKRVVRLVLRR